MTAKFMASSPDLTRFGRGTGALRNMRPVYLDFLPPCNHPCPAGGDIQGWLALAQEGCYEEAWQTLIENNPMLSIHGRGRRR
jgi:formate dehydrogenase beta subunit